MRITTSIENNLHKKLKQDYKKTSALNMNRMEQIKKITMRYRKQRPRGRQRATWVNKIKDNIKSEGRNIRKER